MKRIAVLIVVLFLVSCDNKEKPTVTEQPVKPTLSQQIQAPLDKAKGVEELLQKGKDEREEAMNQQFQ